MQYYYELESSIYDITQAKTIYKWVYYNLDIMPPDLQYFTGTETQLKNFLANLEA